MRNLVNLSGVEKGYGSRSVLRQTTLGVNDGDRVGIVGRNGDKEIRRIEAALSQVNAREMSLHDEIAINSSDHTQLGLLHTQLDALSAEREQLETAWLEASETLGQSPLIGHSTLGP
jgi:ABC-type lipopolysaccharide export system ATPase subunit